MLLSLKFNLFCGSSPSSDSILFYVTQEVTGIYTNNFDLSLNTKNGFPVFATVVEANYVAKKQDLFSAYKLTQEDKEEIEKLAKDPRIGERVCYLASVDHLFYCKRILIYS